MSCLFNETRTSIFTGVDNEEIGRLLDSNAGEIVTEVSDSFDGVGHICWTVVPADIEHESTLKQIIHTSNM